MSNHRKMTPEISKYLYLYVVSRVNMGHSVKLPNRDHDNAGAMMKYTPRETGWDDDMYIFDSDGLFTGAVPLTGWLEKQHTSNAPGIRLVSLVMTAIQQQDLSQPLTSPEAEQEPSCVSKSAALNVTLDRKTRTLGNMGNG